jgi:hypothetical protein
LDGVEGQRDVLKASEPEVCNAVESLRECGRSVGFVEDEERIVAEQGGVEGLRVRRDTEAAKEQTRAELIQGG